MLMRMCEKFTGCRVLSYCLMSNHFHLLLEVPPMPEGGISDQELLERFTKWFNRMHSRTGTLWEDRFKSVIVESGIAARTMAAYIDLNPVRAGMVQDPADYRWSSYGEAVGGGKKGDGKKRRAKAWSGRIFAIRA